MARYQYRATNAQGVEVTDFIEADGVADAARRIEALGLTVQSIAIAQADPRPDALAPTGGDLAAAARRLVDARHQLVEPLRAYAQESARGRRQGELRRFADLLAAGDEEAVLADILAAPVPWGTLLAASAVSGQKSLLERFVQRERPAATLRRQRRIASLYPLAVTVLCLLLLWPIASLVLPSFQEIFNDFGLELPGATLLVLALGRFIRGGGVLVFIGALVVGGVLLMALGRWFPEFSAPLSNRLKNFWRGGSLGMARLSTHTADLLEAALPLGDAVRLSGEHVYATPDNPASDLAMRLSSEPLRAAIAEQPRRPFDYALAAPMESASRVRLLRDLSASYRDRSARSASWAQGVAGPFTIATLGLLVGFIVLALFMPLVKLIEGLT